MSPLITFAALLAGESDDPATDDVEGEIERAREELDAALETLRRARGGWTSAQTIDTDSVRRALDLAERQLDAARVRLQRALNGDPRRKR